MHTAQAKLNVTLYYKNCVFGFVCDFVHTEPRLKDSVWKILNERMTNLINEWINYEGAYRTAPASPGLLKHRKSCE